MSDPPSQPIDDSDGRDSSDHTDRERLKNSGALENPEILRASRRHQRWVLLGLSLIAALAVAGMLQLVYQLDATRTVSFRSVRQAAEQTIEIASTYFRIVSAAIGLLGLHLVLAGYRIFRSSQYPPPGAWIVRDTRLARGFKAHFRGALSLAIGIGLVAVSALFPGWAEAQLAHLFSAALQTPDLPPDAYLPHIE